MPGTARAYGLRDPFDAAAAIGAQARLMRDLLRRFGSVLAGARRLQRRGRRGRALRLRAALPRDQAYVARILGLMGGAGEAVAGGRAGGEAGG